MNTTALGVVILVCVLGALAAIKIANHSESHDKRPTPPILPARRRFVVAPVVYTRETSALETDALKGRPLDAYPTSAMRSLLMAWKDSGVSFDVVSFHERVVGLRGLFGGSASDGAVRQFFSNVGPFYQVDPRAPWTVSRWTQACDIPKDWNPLLPWLVMGRNLNRQVAARDYVLSVWHSLRSADPGSFQYKRWLNFNRRTLDALVAADPGFGDLKLLRDREF
nr:hypothetical protein TetV2_00241 [Oceanusvirus sp.]